MTKLVHGEEEAKKAADAAASLFSGSASSENIPSLTVTADELAADARVSTLLVKAGLCKSQGDARKQIEQNAVAIGDDKVTDVMAAVTAEMIGKDGLILKKGKKGFVRVVLG